MPPKSSKSRSFPHERNTLLEPTEDHDSLVRKCKVQQVVFDAFSVNVIRLKIPVPAKPKSDSVGGQKFITRMKDTDYFQVLSMFEVAFPFATEKEKDAEKVYIEKTHPVVQDTNVKGLWVTSDIAIQLGKEYNLEDYVRALRDASPDKPTSSLTISTTGSKISGSASAPSTPNLQPGAPRRSRRSVSPKKSTARPRTPKEPKAPSSTTSRGRKKKGSTADAESVASSSSPRVPPAVVIKAEEAIDKIVEEGKPILDSIKVGENDSAELLAAAKAQVEAAKAEEETAPPDARVKRALDIDKESPAAEVPVKRARVDDLEREVWVDGRRGRALLGLAIGLGASVVLPYLI